MKHWFRFLEDAGKPVENKAAEIEKLLIEATRLQKEAEMLQAVAKQYEDSYVDTVIRDNWSLDDILKAKQTAEAQN